MTEIIARCPGCSASFRANPAQIEASNGQVSCGTCLLIFDARAHPIENEPEKDNVPEKNLSLDSDDLLIYDDMDISVLDTYEQEGDEQQKESTPDKMAHTDIKPHIEPEPPEYLKPADNINSTGSSQNLASTDLSLPDPIQQDLLTTATHNAADRPQIKTEPGLFEPNETATPSFLLGEPELSQRQCLKMALWPTLSVLAALALALQYVYFHADILGSDPAHRPWLNHFCNITTCQLPSMSDTTQIRSSKLLVHSHPDEPGVLIVDAVIINEADFDQPFPELALNFEDLQGASVARRKFRPDEYLHGELTGATIMPANQPVKLTLKLLDPGSNAVNYSLFIPE